MEIPETVYADVKGVLTELAVQLGTGVETFWPEFVKVQLWGPILALFLIVVGIIFAYVCKKCSEGDNEGIVVISALTASFFIIIGTLGFVINGQCFISPEYCALKEVLQLVNPTK